MTALRVFQAIKSWITSKPIGELGTLEDKAITEADSVKSGLEKLQGQINKKGEQLTSLSYQTPTIVGTQIRITKHGMTRLYFKLDSVLSGGNITISLDNGVTSLPLKDIDGNNVTSLDKGFVEVVDSTTFFTYAPKKVVQGQKGFKGYSTFELFMRYGFDPVRTMFQ